MHYRTLLIVSASALACAFSAAACDVDKDDERREGSFPSIVGEAPEDATEIIADAVCQRVSTCGDFVVSCADIDHDNEPSIDPDTEIGCVVEHIVFDYDACVAEIEPEIRADLDCVDLTDDEAALVDACLEAMADQPCPTVEAVDAAANGHSDAGSELWTPPAPCDEVEAIFARCNQGDSDTPSPTPSPPPLPDPEPAPTPEPE